MKKISIIGFVFTLLLSAVLCNAADLTLMASSGCPQSLQTDASGCAGKIELSGPFSISITPECVVGARNALINQLLTGNTLSAQSYDAFKEIAATRDLVTGIYFGLAAIGVTAGIIALQSDLPGMEKASWATVSLVSPVVFYYVYRVALPAFVNEEKANSELRKAVDSYNNTCADKAGNNQ